ncbi:hypothetical protein SKAU_G00111650 [Synaphobranchus kaupii]|uniref:Uncharacterized protein n=1 Tax=Synaphobranchus kaupii TaxID=118154 RepID=A0A9Q1G176_SYNKA|nr:hypothetical protein SKAU_G00111650 [Synaphobranchus kaupii]
MSIKGTGFGHYHLFLGRGDYSPPRGGSGAEKPDSEEYSFSRGRCTRRNYAHGRKREVHRDVKTKRILALQEGCVKDEAPDPPQGSPSQYPTPQGTRRPKDLSFL